MTPAATDTITIPIIAEDRANALLHALDTLAAGDSPASSAAKHATRLRFALNRLNELRALAVRDRGVFAPSRVDVALSVLETNIAIANQFVARARGAELSGRNSGGRPLPTSTSNVDDPTARNVGERDQMANAKPRPAAAKRSQPAASIATTDDDDAAFDAHVVQTAA